MRDKVATNHLDDEDIAATRQGSARVPACNFPASRRKAVFGGTPNSTRETQRDAYAPQNPALRELVSSLAPSQLSIATAAAARGTPRNSDVSRIERYKIPQLTRHDTSIARGGTFQQLNSWTTSSRTFGPSLALAPLEELHEGASRLTIDGRTDPPACRSGRPRTCLRPAP